MSNEMMSIEAIASKILLVRGKKIMLDRDLAELYRVETKYLKRQVRRNLKRFPDDFMFQLNRDEYVQLLRCQSGTLEKGKYSKYLPFVFTQEGVAMLSGVLDSSRAIKVNIAIMRAFVKLRELLLTHKELSEKIDALDRKYAEHDKQFMIVFEAIRQLLQPPQAPEKTPIGFT